MRNFFVSAIVTAIVILGPGSARAQEDTASDPAAESVESGAVEQAETPEAVPAQTPSPAPAPALSCEAQTADLSAELDAAKSRIAVLEADLAAANRMTDAMNGQVRDAQRIIRDLEAERDELQARLNGGAGSQCPDPGTGTDAPVQCAASASEVEALRAQVAACTAGADPDATLQAQIDQLTAQVAELTAERDTLQARLDAGGTSGGSVQDPDIATLQAMIDDLTAREAEAVAALADATERLTTMTVERDSALEYVNEAQTAISEALAERDAARNQLAQAEANIVEIRAAAVTAIGVSSGALTVCDNSPVPGGVVLTDEIAARAFKAGLGVIGNDVEVLIAPVPAGAQTVTSCILQPIEGLTAPASQQGTAFTADFGTVLPAVDALPRSADCDALLATTAVQDTMASAAGFGSAKRALWVQDAGVPALCGSLNGEVGLLRVEPRNQSAVLFLLAQTF